MSDIMRENNIYCESENMGNNRDQKMEGKVPKLRINSEIEKNFGWLKDLPEEIMWEIWRYLEIEEVITFIQNEKELERLLHNDQIWKMFWERDYDSRVKLEEMSWKQNYLHRTRRRKQLERFFSQPRLFRETMSTARGYFYHDFLVHFNFGYIKLKRLLVEGLLDISAKHPLSSEYLWYKFRSYEQLSKINRHCDWINCLCSLDSNYDILESPRSFLSTISPRSFILNNSLSLNSNSPRLLHELLSKVETRSTLSSDNKSDYFNNSSDVFGSSNSLKEASPIYIEINEDSLHGFLQHFKHKDYIIYHSTENIPKEF